MNVDPTPNNLLAFHDLVSETLAAAHDRGESLGYGIALFPRLGRFEAPVFGVLTCGGESTTLTYRLLHDLIGCPIYISGRVPATVSDAMAYSTAREMPLSLLGQPVLHLLLTMYVGASVGDLERTQPLESTLFAGDLTAPLVLLTETRPRGWPL